MELAAKTDTEINETELKSPEINPYMYEQLITTKEQRTYNMEITISSKIVLGKLDSHIQSSETRPLFYTTQN